VPAASLSEDAPLYRRPLRRPADLDARHADDPGLLPPPADAGADLVSLLTDPSWVYRQYDHQLFSNTVVGPGGDAAVLRLAAPGVRSTDRGLALSTDSNPRWCALDPRSGAAAIVAEAALNVACAGARPAAVVNCLNFGNPEHPEVMWQLSEAIDGMSEACVALGLPVIGGNVSFYNESGGRDIDPTPVVGVVGLIDELRAVPPGNRLAPGSSIVVLGSSAGDGPPSLAGSRWAVEVRGHRDGTPPPIDLVAHRALVDLVADLVGDQVAGPGRRDTRETGILGIHDVSGGGIAVALAEMALGSGIGFEVSGIADHRALFSEAPSRVVVATADPEVLLARAGEAGVPARVIGVARGDRMVVEGLFDVALEDARAVWLHRLPGALDELAANS